MPIAPLPTNFSKNKNAVKMKISRKIFVMQEKGGVGKTTISRALAESVPNAGIVEIDVEQRLREYADRLSYFPMRSSRSEIEISGGQASVAEFDAPIAHLFSNMAPEIIDVGANTSLQLLEALGTVAGDFQDAGIELAVIVVTTAEPDAMSVVPRLRVSAIQAHARCFVVENQMHNAIPAERLHVLADGGPTTSFARQNLDPVTISLISANGLAGVNQIDRAALLREFGPLRGARIYSQALRFRLEAMEAVGPAATWLAG